jgi:membrane protease YdiL (CAAX protease family)
MSIHVSRSSSLQPSPSRLRKPLAFGVYLAGFRWLVLSRAINPVTALQVFATGVVPALAVEWSRSLWSAIVAYSFNDFLAFVVFRV